jgi:DMSO/TMAO reductase YedYZ molybdopterin-dependent catalytic subunit
MEDNTLVAYEMNGAPLPHFNGFPARVIVPGWTGTYWMKHITSIRTGDQAGNRVLDEPGLLCTARQISDRRALHLAGRPPSMRRPPCIFPVDFILSLDDLRQHCAQRRARPSGRARVTDSRAAQA